MDWMLEQCAAAHLEAFIAPETSLQSPGLQAAPGWGPQLPWSGQ